MEVFNLNKKGVSTTIEIIGMVLAIAIPFLIMMSKANYRTGDELNNAEIKFSQQWQTNGAEK